MQLPDEAIAYHYQAALVPPIEDWTPLAELRAQHLIAPARLRELQARLMQVRSQVAAERDLKQVPPELQPLEAGFIDLPQRLLDEQRKLAETSTLGRILRMGRRLREEVDRFIILGQGGAALGARALFAALRSGYHNDLPAKDRGGSPRIYFEGDNADNDALQELLDMIQITCVDPELHEERWGAAVISKTGTTLETAAAYRVLRRELAEYYGNHSPRSKNLVVPITGPVSKLRDLCKAANYPDDNILTIPADVGDRFAIFTAAGLLPAVVMGLDVRALLLGAASMTQRFLDEPFERNPVLQFAAVNYLMYAERHKPIRVLSVWSKKLEALGPWYEQLLAESLGKHGVGPTPLTAVQTRDLHARGQLHQEGPRDKFINNLVVKAPHQPAIMFGMADRNEDELNTFNRKGLPDVMSAALRGTNQAHAEAARPTADLELPILSEHTMGQLLQMLMLATVVEGHLLGINPYGPPGAEPAHRNMLALLKA